MANKTVTPETKAQGREAVQDAAIEYLKVVIDQLVDKPNGFRSAVVAIEERLKADDWSSEAIQQLSLLSTGRWTARAFYDHLEATARHLPPPKRANTAWELLSQYVPGDMMAALTEKAAIDTVADTAVNNLRAGLASIDQGSMSNTPTSNLATPSALARNGITSTLAKLFIKSLSVSKKEWTTPLRNANLRLSPRLTSGEIQRLTVLSSPSKPVAPEVSFNIAINGVRLSSVANGICRLSLPNGRTTLLEGAVSFSGTSAQIYAHKSAGGRLLMSASPEGITWVGIGMEMVPWEGEAVTRPAADDPRSLVALGERGQTICADLAVSCLADLAWVYRADFSVAAKNRGGRGEAEVLAALRQEGIDFRKAPAPSFGNRECFLALGENVAAALGKIGVHLPCDLATVTRNSVADAMWMVTMSRQEASSLVSKVAEIAVGAGVSFLATSPSPMPHIAKLHPSHSSPNNAQYRVDLLLDSLSGPSPERGGIRWDPRQMSDAEQSLLAAFADAIPGVGAEGAWVPRIRVAKLYDGSVRAVLDGLEHMRLELDSSLEGADLPALVAGMAFRWLPVMTAASEPLRAVTTSGEVGEMSEADAEGRIRFRADGEIEARDCTLADIDVIAPGQAALTALCAALGVPCASGPHSSVPAP